MKWSIFTLFTLSLAASACRTSSGGATAKSDDAGTVSDADNQPLPPYEPKYVKVPVDSRKAPTTKPAQLGMALAEGTDRYFVTMYGFQGTGPFNLPRFTHTWALFIHADNADLSAAALDAFTISWDAADGVIGLLQPVKPGHNYTLEETLNLANNLGNVAVQRSPIYEINQTLWQKGFDKSQYLANGEGNGQVRYKMIDDLGGRQGAVNHQNGGYSNCTHAVSDVLRGAQGQLLETGGARGFSASDAVLQWYMESPYFINPGATHDAELASQLGI